MKNDLITLDSLNAKNLPELQGLKDKQLELVKECPFVEIVDNKSYELAKKHRTTLLKGRTSLESQDKLIASKLSALRKDVKSVTDELILITLPHEEKQQEEVKRFEQIKENERLEKERIENERIENIQNKIKQLENDSYIIINSWNVDILKTAHNSILSTMDTDFDFEEFDILYQQAKLRVQEHAENKVNSLTIQENQRIENERLAREKAESDAKLEAIQKQQEKERLDREEKEEELKEKQLEIRINRLIEAGLIYSSEHDTLFVDEDCDFILLKEDIANSDIIEFEDIVIDSKKRIKDFKDFKLKKAEKEKEAEILKQKSEKENKARVKRLSNDKKIISESLEVYFADLHLETENKESIEFIETANIQIQQLKSILLTQLNNL